nr:hypothetical protein CFP56_73895 [Quercus suber]
MNRKAEGGSDSIVVMQHELLPGYTWTIETLCENEGGIAMCPRDVAVSTPAEDGPEGDTNEGCAVLYTLCRTGSAFDNQSQQRSVSSWSGQGVDDTKSDHHRRKKVACLR